MLFFEWLVIMACSMAAVVIFFGLGATRRQAIWASQDEQVRMRSTLLRVGLVADTTSAVFAGTLLGIDWLLSLLVGLVFYSVKIALSDAWIRRINEHPAAQLTQEQKWELQERAAAAAEEDRSPYGWLCWTGFAIVNVCVLLVLLLPFRGWPSR